MLDYSRDLDTVATDFDSIPIIDFGPFINGENPHKVASEIAYALTKVGFMYIKNHGVDKSLIDDMFAVTKAYFAQPFEEKEKHNIIHSGPTLRGYIPMYAENVDPDYTRDFKECYDYGKEEEQVSPFYGPNPKPSYPPNFQEVTTRYHTVVFNLSQQITRAIAMSLGLSQDFFNNSMKNPITIQRLLHYPPQHGEIKVDEMGIGAHTDYGFLTILCQDQIGGLQVQNAKEQWIEAPPIEDTFIVNIGDLLQTLTNNRYKSTIHRVINRSGQERYSIPFFLDMDFDAVIKPVPTCATAKTDKAFIPYCCGEHKFKRFVDSYAHLKDYKTQPVFVKKKTRSIN